MFAYLSLHFSHAHFFSLTHSLLVCVSLSHTHTHTLSPFLTPQAYLSHSLSLSPSHTHSFFSHTLSRSFSLYHLSLTHTHTLTLSLSHTLSFISHPIYISSLSLPLFPYWRTNSAFKFPMSETFNEKRRYQKCNSIASEGDK